MCLSAFTSRRPLFTTAYKILEKIDNRWYTPYAGSELSNSDIIENRWVLDWRNYSLANVFEYYTYTTGFHSYINLSDAMKRCEEINNNLMGKEKQFTRFHVFEVDTDDIVVYGVEKQIDVVVSRKIRFIQQII